MANGMKIEIDFRAVAARLEMALQAIVAMNNHPQDVSVAKKALDYPVNIDTKGF